MTHEELARTLTDAMDAMEQRLERRIHGVEDRHNMFVSGTVTRLDHLEHSSVEKTKSLSRIEAKLDRLLAVVGEVHDLKALMAVWAREHRDLQDDGK